MHAGTDIAVVTMCESGGSVCGRVGRGLHTEDLTKEQLGIICCNTLNEKASLRSVLRRRNPKHTDDTPTSNNNEFLGKLTLNLRPAIRTSEGDM